MRDQTVASLQRFVCQNSESWPCSFGLAEGLCEVSPASSTEAMGILSMSSGGIAAISALGCGFQASCGIATRAAKSLQGFTFAPRDGQRAPNHYVHSSR